MLQKKTTIAAMFVVNRSGSPVLGGRQSHLPITMGKAFPGLQFNHAVEPQVMRKIANPPGHHAYFRRRQLAQRGAMKMIEMCVCEEHQIDGRQIADPATSPLDTLEQEKPIREIWVN